jgi:hypothetical protein
MCTLLDPTHGHDQNSRAKTLRVSLVEYFRADLIFCASHAFFVGGMGRTGDIISGRGYFLL